MKDEGPTVDVTNQTCATERQYIEQTNQTHTHKSETGTEYIELDFLFSGYFGDPPDCITWICSVNTVTRVRSKGA